METDSILETLYSGPDVVFSMYIKQPDGIQYFRRQLPIAYRHDSLRTQQFEQELTLLETLTNIPGVLRGKRAKRNDGNPAIIYDFQEYMTLGQIIRDCTENGQRIPLPLAINWATLIIESIEKIKSAAINFNKPTIDIAIWPDALFIDMSGNIRITHFSLNTPHSISSSIIKPDLKRYFLYAAPEQVIAGQAPDERVLYFVLGMLIFELLTSRPLIGKNSATDSMQVVRRKLRRLHPLLSDADSQLEPLDKLVNELLAPHPDTRLNCLSEVKNQLLELRVQLKADDHQPVENTFQKFINDLSDKLKNTSQPGNNFETTNINQFNAS